MTTPRKDRTWTIALCVFGIAFWTATVGYFREIAEWKVAMQHLMLHANAKTDFATVMISNLEFFRMFMLYSAFLIGLTPILIGKAARLWFGLLLLAILSVPSLWYGMQAVYLISRLIDSHALAGL